MLINNVRPELSAVRIVPSVIFPIPEIPVSDKPNGRIRAHSKRSGLGGIREYIEAIQRKLERGLEEEGDNGIAIETVPRRRFIGNRDPITLCVVTEQIRFPRVVSLPAEQGAPERVVYRVVVGVHPSGQHLPKDGA
jgi:hypothetical protein